MFTRCFTNAFMQLTQLQFFQTKRTVRLGIFLLELGKNHTIWHWEWGRISAPDFGNQKPCFMVAMATRILHEFQIFEQFSVSTTQDHSCEIWLKLAQLFIRRCCLKKLWMDGWTDCRRRQTVSDQNSSTQAFGSGELKSRRRRNRAKTMSPHFIWET